MGSILDLVEEKSLILQTVSFKSLLLLIGATWQHSQISNQPRVLSPSTSLPRNGPSCLVMLPRILSSHWQKPSPVQLISTTNIAASMLVTGIPTKISLKCSIPSFRNTMGFLQIPPTPVI